MDKSKQFRNRLFIPVLIVIIGAWACALTGVTNLTVTLLIQTVGICFIIIANLIWIAIVDIPATYPDSNYTKQLNRLTFVREND